MINVHCSRAGRGGFAEHGRGFVDALRRRCAVRVIDNGDAGFDPSAPGLGIGPIERMTRVGGTPRIGWVVWETTILPPAKLEILQSLDELWTPSTWGRDVLIANGLDERRVHVVPEGFDAMRFTVPSPHRSGERVRVRGVSRERDDVSRPFRFLCVARWTVRKGVSDLVNAWCRTFAPDEPVELVLHCWDQHKRNFDLRATLASAIRGAHAPIVASMPVGVDALVDLYQRCDAFVLPTRAEGWGLPIVEAMACGLPAIVTDYSAPSDYIDEAIAYPLRVERMIEVDDPYYFPEGRALGVWAQPDVDHLQSMLRHVYENREEARAKGLRAAHAMRERWTWDHAAEKAWQRLGGDACAASK